MEDVGGHAPAAQDARGEVVEQDVGLHEQLAQHLAALGLREVERERALAAVHDVERRLSGPTSRRVGSLSKNGWPKSARVWSRRCGGSTLMTSAPRSASSPPR